MTEEYLSYWGLEQHPFLLAPDSRMMYITGQYYECLERLKYAINTSKGGALIISEDAGLGKTTILLRLIEEMTEKYREVFRYAFIDHPTLTASQIIAQITGAISQQPVDDDKLKNLALLKQSLIQVKESGGKSIIIVDEGQMLCRSPEVLQELRALINLTHENEYLHTFILSGQKALWETLKDMPEFWQRLPVRFYFVPLRLNETKEMLRFRLRNAGLEDRRRIFTEDALNMIHKFAGGSPRTIIALSDLCLLVGYTSRVERIGFKEVTKAIQAMLGRGESLQYVSGGGRETDEPVPESPPIVPPDVEDRPRLRLPDIAGAPLAIRLPQQVRPLFAVLAVLLSLLVGAVGYHYLFGGARTQKSNLVAQEVSIKPEAKEVPQPQAPVQQAQAQELRPAEAKPAEVNAPEVRPADVKPAEPQPAPIKPAEAKPEAKKAEIRAPEMRVAETRTPEAKSEKRLATEKREKPGREAVVKKDAANVRVSPNINGQRIGMIMNGQRIRILDEKTDRDGERWYKVLLYGEKYGWIAASTVAVR